MSRNLSSRTFTRMQFKRGLVIVGVGLGLSFSMGAGQALAAETPTTNGDGANPSDTRRGQVERCLKDAGIAVPSNPPKARGNQGGDNHRSDIKAHRQDSLKRRSEIKAALKACGLDMAREFRQERREELRSCLESQGIKVPKHLDARSHRRHKVDQQHEVEDQQKEQREKVSEALKVCKEKVGPSKA